MDAVQLTGATTATITPTIPAPADVDVAELLTVAAALLLEQPARILANAHLVATVLKAAGPQVSTVALRPVWEALPTNPEGDEHREYAARLILAAKNINTEQQRGW